jgi:hypothetical protein
VCAVAVTAGVWAADAAPANGDTASAVTDSSETAVLSDRTDVYYFHRTIRCENCLRFEAYAEEALRSNFPEELANGRLTWSVLDFENEANATMVEHYDVFESSLIVSEIAAGDERDWKKLEAIWSIRSDKSAFLDYVAVEVESLLIRECLGEPNDKSSVPVHGELVP